MLQRLREPVNTISHFIGAVLALLGGAWLVYLHFPSVPRMGVSAIYSLTMFLGFTASFIMHSYIGDRKIIKWLIRLDHAAIFLMIAGTYTPIVYAMSQGTWRWTLLGVIWVIAIAGATWKLLTWDEDSIWQTLSYFSTMLVAFVMLPDVITKLPTMGVSLLVLGGLFYIIGTIVFVLEKPNLHEHFGFHEIWHIFVLLGASTHFVAIAWYILA